MDMSVYTLPDSENTNLHIIKRTVMEISLTERIRCGSYADDYLYKLFRRLT